MSQEIQEANVNSSAEGEGLIAKIREIIEKEVRPSLQDDGGDIEFVDFEDNIVKVKLYGACAHCPSSLMHMHGDVEELLKEKVPEIEGLELVS